MQNFRLALPILAGLLLYLQPQARADVIDFEGQVDSTILTNQYPGLIFTNAIILTAGISLNEFELPPHSGTNVALDNDGPITIDFATPVLSFNGYFTYAVPLTLDAFDSLDIQVGSAVSAFSSNDALFGDAGSSPNEFLQVAFAGGISSVVITGNPAGGSFAIDDISFTSAVPEPSSLLLFVTGALGLRVLRRRISR